MSIAREAARPLYASDGEQGRGHANAQSQAGTGHHRARRVNGGISARAPARCHPCFTGRIDARIAGLELVNWQPVKFDAQLASSAGDYPRKISQAAVQNISALGGAGAAAAIQRSFLRFFEQFGYDKLGWRCKLQNGVCEMSGVEDAPQGYVLVKGGGIP